jgi:Nucleoside-diphosphate-sugar epimerases
MDKNSYILITGANGFIGKNLTANLTAAGYINLLLFDKDTAKESLAEFVQKCVFVFHLAGINRPQNTAEFYEGNASFTEHLLALLKDANNTCPVLVTSSTQATLDNDYGKSKLQAEEALFAYEKETGATVYCYRLPGVFGKWCRPNYNSVVATFCHNIANGEEIFVRDPSAEITLVYIDDVINAFMQALQGAPEKDGDYCTVLPVHSTTLGFLASAIQSFPQTRQLRTVPKMEDSLTRKLYSTYLSYLPTSAFAYELPMNIDERGSFTEFVRTDTYGQFSVNISKPGIVKGNHWHNTKNEKFLVVKGTGVIRFRNINETEVITYNVSGDTLTVVDIPTGYTHNIENTGDEDMVTLMWANEAFDPENPDTYFMLV